MKNLSLPVIMAAAAMLWLPVPSASALEMRTWLSVDGRMLEAELVRQVGSDVELRDKDGKPIKIARSSLSFGDLDYIEENAPADTAPKALGSAPTAKVKLPNPAKDVKIDTKLFKKESGDFKINSRTYRVCETPHFKVMYMRPVDPMDMAELAERLWVDTAFFHSTFIPKWQDRKMGILLVNDDEAYEDAGSWYADMISEAGNKDDAERIRKTWPPSSAGTIQMPQAQADEKGIFSAVRVFRAYTTPATVDSNGKVTKGKPQMVKGVWDSFRTHGIAQALLGVQAGGLNSTSTEGNFAVFTGFAFYKEISLTGKCGTNLLGTKGTGKDVTTSSGFQQDKNWPAELKKMIKKGGEWKPNLMNVFAAQGQSPSTQDIVFSYAFSRFLQSTPERLTAFNKLCQKIDVSNQVPGLEEIAKLYGFDSASALETAWITWMDGGDFR